MEEKKKLPECHSTASLPDTSRPGQNELTTGASAGPHGKSFRAPRRISAEKSIRRWRRSDRSRFQHRRLRYRSQGKALEEEYFLV